MNDSDMLLAKTRLPDGWIDMGIGEAKIVLQYVKRGGISVLPHIDPMYSDLSYLGPQGYVPFVRLLEYKYKHHCTVSVGAKQGLMASFMAMKSIYKTQILTVCPYWTSLPVIANSIGVYLNIRKDYNSLLEILKDPIIRDTSAVLVVSPNNPDGSIIHPDVFDEISKTGE